MYFTEYKYILIFLNVKYFLSNINIYSLNTKISKFLQIRKVLTAFIGQCMLKYLLHKHDSFPRSVYGLI